MSGTESKRRRAARRPPARGYSPRDHPRQALRGHGDDGPGARHHDRRGLRGVPVAERPLRRGLGRSDRQALALEIKYAVTDVNGWQTAYGYDDGASRPQFERSAQNVRRLLAVADRRLTEPRERAILARLHTLLRRASWRSTSSPIARCRPARTAASSGSSSARRSATSRPWRAAAAQLAAEEQRRNDQVERAFDQRLTDAKKTPRGRRARRRGAHRPAAAHRIGHRPPRAGATGQP